MVINNIIRAVTRGPFLEISNNLPGPISIFLNAFLFCSDYKHRTWPKLTSVERHLKVVRHFSDLVSYWDFRETAPRP